MKPLSYKRNEITEAYDAIIIGSGIGSLACAVFLANAGKKVVVLEKHYVAGGFTHVFKRPGYEWDVGIHYIGEVMRKNSFIRLFFDYLTEENLEWEDMGEVYDRIVFPDKTYDFVKGRENWRKQMKEYFPEEGDVIDQYMDMVIEAAGAARGFFMDHALPPTLSKIAAPFMGRGKFLKYSDKTTLETLRSITKNERLIAVLCGQYGDYGLPPGQGSFGMHAMVVRHYFNGGAYPVGGCTRIFDTIYPQIKRGGGEVYVNAGVEEILTENKRAVGVRMEDGAELRAPLVISGAGVVNTYAHLLTGEVSKKFKLDTKLHDVKPSASHVCLYIGLKETAEELGLQKPNLWIYPGYDHDKSVADYMKDQSNPLPVTYISFPSAKDPTWQDRFPGTATIEIIGLAPYEWFAKWENERWKKRGDEYKELKEQYAQRMLEQLYQQVPQVKGKIDYYELSSPLSTRQFTQYQTGEIYGIDHTPERFRLHWLRANTPIKGLYLTGQDIATAGIGGAMAGGLITASAILRKNLINEMTRRRKAVAQ